MTKQTLELQVGIFIFIGLVILTVIVFSIGGIQIYQPGYHLKAMFNFVYGLEKGAPVRLAGVSVGEVKEVKIYRDPEKDKTLVELLLWIEKDVKIEQDSKAYISTLGLFGEKYIELIPGTPGQRLLVDGEVIIGTDPVSMERFSEQVQRLAKEFTATMESVNEVVGDKEVRDSLRMALKDSKDLVSDLKELSSSAGAVLAKVEKGEGTIGKLLTEDKLYRDLEAMVEDLKKHPWKLLRKPKKKKR